VTNNVVLVGGDFNLPGWDWQANTLKQKMQFVALHNRFGDIIHDFGLSQVITEPTTLGSTLDLGRYA